MSDPRRLLLIPAATYGLSYLYLALYHGRVDLWSTVVHENGRLTFLETTFYASHFLGHIPVLVTVALLMAGWWRCMAPAIPVATTGWWRWCAAGLAALLALSAAISLWHFGSEDTLAFVLQLKQRPDLYTRGGSWNLHLPSTVLQLLLIPVVVWAARRLWRRPVAWSGKGIVLLTAATALVFAVTWVANGRSLEALLWVWRDPRYLAHSVRELATFPLTYYPIPLAVMLWRESPTRPGARTSLLSMMAVAVTSVVFLAGFGYQLVVSLSHDVGTLAQRPDFAHGGELSVAYLLAAHYFEHVLDTVFFALLTLLLVGAPLKVTRDT